MFELVIRTQSSGPLCLWQCLFSGLYILLRLNNTKQKRKSDAESAIFRCPKDSCTLALSGKYKRGASQTIEANFDRKLIKEIFFLDFWRLGFHTSQNSAY